MELETLRAASGSKTRSRHRCRIVDLAGAGCRFAALGYAADAGFAEPDMGEFVNEREGARCARVLVVNDDKGRDGIGNRETAKDFFADGGVMRA